MRKLRVLNRILWREVREIKSPQSTLSRRTRSTPTATPRNERRVVLDATLLPGIQNAHKIRDLEEKVLLDRSVETVEEQAHDEDAHGWLSVVN